MDQRSTVLSPIAGSGKPLGVAITLLATVALAIGNVTIPTVYAHGATPTATIFIRYCVLIAALLAAMLALGQRLRLQPKYYGHALVAGGLSCIGSLGTITAFSLIPVSLTLVILYLYPILTAILQSLIERKPVSLGQFACLLTAFAGLAIALGIGGAGFAQGVNPLGILSVLLAAFGFAGFFVWSRFGLAGAEPGATVLFTSLTGAALALAVGLALHASGTALFLTPDFADGPGWAAMLAVSVCFAIAYFSMSLGVQLIGPAPATLLMNMETVFTLSLAAAFLGETLDARRLTGAGLVLASVVASQILASRQPR